jgi:hypothetical protein
MHVTFQPLRDAPATVHRIDLPCERTGFSRPPCPVHLRALPEPGGWTLLLHGAAGKAPALARWLQPHVGVEHVRVGPGLAPKALRAHTTHLPPAWSLVASFAQVHQLDLAPDGHAAWFVAGPRERVWALVQALDAAPHPAPPDEVRWRPVPSDPPISRRQMEMLSTAVALGYYEIPHRLDLRTLATRSGISLGSVSELLRRAEGAVLTHYVDTSLMGWPVARQDPSSQAAALGDLLLP